MEFLFKNRGRNCLDKWSAISFLFRKWINNMISVIFFSYRYIEHFNVVQDVMHYYISHKGQG